jgi:methionine synthase II (cobalamin-independent)
MNDLQASAAVTLIGSMPHQNRREAVELVLQAVPEIPVWPQLSNYKAEQMMIQFLEGLPGAHPLSGDLVLSTADAQVEDEIYAFYEEYLEIEDGRKDLLGSRFCMGPETAQTFFEFLEYMQTAGVDCKAVKGQIVGPFTLLTGLKDQRNRALLYDDRYVDLVTKHLAMKAKWQIQHLKSLGSPVIIFLDEPALAGFGSSTFISVSRELIQSLLKEVVDAVHQAGALAGIHICANTDWLLAFESSVEIINFDSYNYFDKFALYKESFNKFISEKRIIAWGVVPTSDPYIISQETSNSLADRWIESVGQLSSDEFSIEAILAQSLFTPSCGCASLPKEAAERVLSLTHELGHIMRAKL